MMAINTLHAACETTLREVHHSKISAHHAKTGYKYPTIHLPFAFSGLIGLSTRIYQTVHDGALAFLVVVSSADKTAEISVKKLANDKISLKCLRHVKTEFLRRSAVFSDVAFLGETTMRNASAPS